MNETETERLIACAKKLLDVLDKYEEEADMYERLDYHGDRVDDIFNAKWELRQALPLDGS